MEKPRYTWMNGELVPWADSRIHVNSDAILRGASVFEGLRAYRAADSEDLLLFRVGDHLKRLFGTSMRFVRMSLSYGPDELTAAMIKLLRANEVREDAHLRLTAYFEEVEYGRELEATAGAFILAFPRPTNPKQKTGVRTMLSPWRRLSDTSMSPRVKASANYMNSRVALADARSKGFDIPILLNDRGKVSEGPGQNVFLVRDGVLITPRITDAILEGVTRVTILDLAREASIAVEEREVDATELYVADELFFCGTAMEVQFVAEHDGYRIGDGTMGPVTSRIHTDYFDLVRGRAGAPEGWLTRVYGERVAA